VSELNDHQRQLLQDLDKFYTVERVSDDYDYEPLVLQFREADYCWDLWRRHVYLPDDEEVVNGTPFGEWDGTAQDSYAQREFFDYVVGVLPEFVELTCSADGGSWLYLVAEKTPEEVLQLFEIEKEVEKALARHQEFERECADAMVGVEL
jgi:hypothetical protein